jgi:hypothetical protein
LEEINQNHLKYFFKKLLQNRLKQKSIIVFWCSHRNHQNHFMLNFK